MKKRFIVITMVLCLVFSLFTVTSSAMSKKPKYVKVKKATYQAYKKAYKNQKTLNNQIKKYKAQISVKQNTIEQLKKKNAELADQASMNKWLWNNVRSLGLSYKNKTWTIPAEYPQSFIIDGVKYQVVFETIEEGE